MKMRADTQKNSLSQSRSSIFLRTRLLKEVEAAFGLAKTVLIESGPLSGKSVLVKQIVNHLKSTQPDLPIFQLEIRNPMEFQGLLQPLSQVLGLDRSLQSVGELIDVLNQKHALLIIDNLDRVEGADIFLNEFLGNLDQGSALFTFCNLPNVDPLKVLDFRILRNLSFTSEELKEWLKQLGISLSKELSMESFLQKTKGHASVIRSALSLALIEARSVESRDLLEFQSKLVFQTVISRLKAEALGILYQISLVEKPSSYLAELLRKVDPSTRKLLDAFGLVEVSAMGFLLQKDFCEFLKAQMSETERHIGREKILLELTQQENSYETQEECIRQLIHLDRKPEAAQILNTFIFEMGRRFKEEEVLELTDATWKYLSRDAYFLRRTVIIHRRGHYGFDGFEKVIEELRYLIEHSTNDSDRAYHTVMLARTMHQANDPTGDELTQSALKLSKEGSDEWLWSKLTMQMRRMHSHTSEAYQALLDLKSWASDPQRSELLRAFLFCNLGLAAEELGLFNEAFAYANLSFEILQRWGFVSAARTLRNNRAYALRGIGKLKEAAVETEILLDQYKAAKVTRSAQSAADMMVSYRIEQGKIRQALDLWKEYNPHFHLHQQFGINASDVLVPLIQIKLRQGGIHEVLDMIKLVRQNPSISADTRIHRLSLLSQIFELKSYAQLPAEISEVLRTPRPQLTPVDRAGILADVLVYAFMDQKKLSADSYRGLVESILMESIPAYERHRIKTYFALQNIFDADLNDLKAELSEALDYFKSNDVFLGLVICELGLAILDLRRKDFRFAEAHLRAALQYESEVDPCEELSWAKVILAELTASASSERLDNFLQISDDSYAADFLKMRLGRLKSTESFWALHLLQLFAGFGTYDLGDNADSQASSSGLKLNSKNRSLNVRGKNVDLSDRQVLWSLSELFITQPDRFFSKEELVKLIWKEEYNPLVHDTRIYTSMRRLRSIVEPLLEATFIETREGCYGYQKKVD